MDKVQPSICVVGAGLSGTMAACLLSKLGFHIDVYEKRKNDITVSSITLII